MQVAIQPSSPAKFESDFWGASTVSSLRLERGLLCDVAGRTMSLGIEMLRDVLPIQAVAMLPGTPPWVLGLTSVRGTVVGVVDLARYLGLTNASAIGNWQDGSATAARLLVCSDGQRTLALAVNSTYGVVDFAPSDVQALVGLPGTLGRFATGLLFASSYGPEAHGAVLLDVRRLLRDDELVGR